ncbi:MAG: Hsp20/alpha crystallin family protein [Tepidisphaerales bacterium]
MLPLVRISRCNNALDTLHREFDTTLNRLFGNSEAPVAWTPYAVDVREDGDHIYVDAELPGFKKDEIDLTMENQTLTISAERHETDGDKKGGYLLKERRYTRFLRSFTLPPTVDDKQVDAKFDNGILSIVLNKREETKPKKIAVG